MLLIQSSAVHLVDVNLSSNCAIGSPNPTFDHSYHQTITFYLLLRARLDKCAHAHTWIQYAWIRCAADLTEIHGT